MFDLAFEDGVATLTLNRPEARNAIPAAGWLKLAEAARQANEARLLAVRGAGPAFCAGADLADFPAMREGAAARSGFREEMRAGIAALAHLPIPTVAVIDGACYGAGVAVAMACDIRLAGPNASFAITPAKFGISYPQEDVHRLVALVGGGQAARLLLGAGAIDGAEAARIGLVESFCPTDLEKQVADLVAAIAANHPASLRSLKQAIALAARGITSDAEQDELFDDLLGSEDFAARLAARRRG